MDISEQQLDMLTSRISMLESLASRIPQMEAVIDEMDDDGAEQQIVRNWGTGGTSYNSYFKVLDASTTVGEERTAKIRVVDGAHATDSEYAIAGPVYANGRLNTQDALAVTLNVPVDVEDEESVADSCVWLKVSRPMVGDDCTLEFEIRKSGEGEPKPIDGVFGYRFILIARIVAIGGKSFSIIQDHYGAVLVDFATFSGYVCHADNERAFIGPPTGEYLAVDIISGSAAYVSEIPENLTRTNIYKVAEKIEVVEGEEATTVYKMTEGIVVGDVRIDFSPYAELPTWDIAET